MRSGGGGGRPRDVSPLPGHPEAGSLLSATARSRTEGEQRPLELNPGEAGEQRSYENIAQKRRRVNLSDKGELSKAVECY